MTKKKQVQTKSNGSAVAILSEFEGVDTGFEEMGADDLQLPRKKTSTSYVSRNRK